MIPPTVAKELLWAFCSINVSVDTAGFLGTLAVGAIGTLVTHISPKQSKESQP